MFIFNFFDQLWHNFYWRLHNSWSILQGKCKLCRSCMHSFTGNHKHGNNGIPCQRPFMICILGMNWHYRDRRREGQRCWLVALIKRLATYFPSTKLLALAASSILFLSISPPFNHGCACFDKNHIFSSKYRRRKNKNKVKYHITYRLHMVH